MSGNLVKQTQNFRLDVLREKLTLKPWEKAIFDLDDLLCELRDTVAKDTSRSQFDQMYERFVIAHEVSESKGYYSEGTEDYLLDIETLLYNLDQFIGEKSSRTYKLRRYFKRTRR
jgi:hypothetical protein